MSRTPQFSSALSTAELRRAPALGQGFFNRDPAIVARELLGKLLIRREGRQSARRTHC